MDLSEGKSSLEDTHSIDKMWAISKGLRVAEPDIISPNFPPFPFLLNLVA